VSVLTLCIDISEGCFRGQIRRLIVNLQPRSLKSHATAVAFPAYVLGHRPVAQIICASYARLYGGGCSQVLTLLRENSLLTGKNTGNFFNFGLNLSGLVSHPPHSSRII
jgi:hypothetical protein